MKTKLLGIAVIFAVLAAPAWAMEIGPATKLGGYMFDQGPAQCMGFQGYTGTQAIPHRNPKTGKIIPDHFDKGTIFYGNKEQPLCFYVGYHSLKTGGLRGDNAWNINAYGGDIFMAQTDEGGTLYFVITDGNVALQLICYGYEPGSSQIYKYFDTRDMMDGSTGLLDYSIYKGNFVGPGRDTITVSYRGRNTNGKLIYRWDEDAQWFGVENVPY